MKKTYERKYGTELNKGITLIALIVTIITMLILAGVSISMMLGNNGILNKATQAKKLYDVSAIKEALEMEKAEIAINQNRVDLDSYLEQITSGEKAYNLNSTDRIDDRNAEIIVNGEHKFLIKDKENGDVEIIYEGMAKIGDLALSSSSGTYTYPTSGTFSVINNSTGGALSVTSETPDVATASISGNTVTVTPGTTAGKARIIVKSAAVGGYAENRAVYMATVENGTITVDATPYTGTYDGAEHDALTNVTTNPSDAKKEYSLNSAEYTTTMPTVKEAGLYTIAVKVSKAGYGTETVTITSEVFQEDGKLSLNMETATDTEKRSGSIIIRENTSEGEITVSSSNPTIATATESDGIITIQALSPGTATIQLTSKSQNGYSSATATHVATVLQTQNTEAVNVTNYGKTVTNYSSPDGDDWKLLYQTSTEVFLQKISGVSFDVSQSYFRSTLSGRVLETCDMLNSEWKNYRTTWNNNGLGRKMIAAVYDSYNWDGTYKKSYPTVSAYKNFKDPNKLNMIKYVVGSLGIDLMKKHLNALSPNVWGNNFSYEVGSDGYHFKGKEYYYELRLTQEKPYEVNVLFPTNDVYSLWLGLIVPCSDSSYNIASGSGYGGPWRI